MMMAELKKNKSEVAEKKGLTVTIPETKGMKMFMALLVGFLISFIIIIPIIFGYEIIMGLLGNRSLTLLNLIAFIMIMVICIGMLFVTLDGIKIVQLNWQDDVFSRDKIIYKGEDFSWNEIEALYMNPDEKYITFLFKELYGRARIAGDYFWKRSIDPSPEAMKKIAIDAGIEVYENETLTCADLVKIQQKIIKNEK
jgi:hypothetical protein